ncbi:MAG: serine hydrolase domain-containing protein [Bacteroidota bacterium]
MRPLVFAAVLLGVPCAAQPALDFGTVDALIADSLDVIGGGAALLVMQDGEVLHRAGYGSFTPETVTLTASAAKWLSGAVLASLVSDGTLTLDDSLAQFFPTLEGEKRGITVRQLFSHTSGIPGGSGIFAAPCLSDGSTTLAACAEAVLALPLDAAPGAAFDYGGNSMQVAGRVAEIASGQSWTTLFADRIAGPLGMTATGYTRTANPRIAGGMVTTVDDYGAFLQMLLDGGTYAGQRVLSPESVAALLADQTREAEVVGSPYDAYAGRYPDLPDEIRYGLGVWRERVGSDGALLEASSQGAFGVSPWIDTERRLGGILLVQDRLPEVMGTYLELKRRIRAIVDGSPVDAEAAPSDSGLRLDVWPNPLRLGATVRYTLPEAAHVEAVLLDALGRQVAVLDAGPRGGGVHRLRLDVAELASGTYHVAVRTGDQREAQTVTVRR